MVTGKRNGSPSFDWTGWFTVLELRSVRGMTADEDPVLWASPEGDRPGLDQQQCAVRKMRTVGRHIRGIDKESLIYLDEILLPCLERLVLGQPPEAGPVLLAIRER